MKQDEASEPVSYAPAVTDAGAAIALYLLSKIGELVVILLRWGAYAALAYAVLHVVAAWLSVPLMALILKAIQSTRDWARQTDLQGRAAMALGLQRQSGS
jgi:hypothetical protein